MLINDFIIRCQLHTIQPLHPHPTRILLISLKDLFTPHTQIVQIQHLTSCFLKDLGGAVEEGGVAGQEGAVEVEKREVLGGERLAC